MPLVADRADASHYADEAIALLRQAVAAGWVNASRTATDPDLTSLHNRNDFRRLVTELLDRTFPADPFAGGK